MIPQQAIHQLHGTKEMLNKKQEDLREEIEQQIMIAKMNDMRNKRAALQALKKKKHLEQQLTRINRVLSIIGFQLETLENANTNTEVLNNMSMAAKAIKGVHETMDMDNIVSLMDDITEGKEIAEEISNAISQPFDDEFDEDEMLSELEELVHEDMGRNMGSTRPSHRTTAVKKTSSTPKEPTHKAKEIHSKLTRRRPEGDITLRQMNLRILYLYTIFILLLCFCILIFFYFKTSIN